MIPQKSIIPFIAEFIAKAPVILLEAGINNSLLN